MPNLPAPSQRYSGISDLRQLQELLAEVREVREKLTTIEALYNFQYLSTNGHVTLLKEEALKELTESPKIEITTTGTYFVGLQLRGRTAAAGLVELRGFLKLSGGTTLELYDYVANQVFDLALITNFTVVTITAGETVTVAAQINAAVESVFDSPAIIVKRIA